MHKISVERLFAQSEEKIARAALNKPKKNIQKENLCAAPRLSDVGQPSYEQVKAGQVYLKMLDFFWLGENLLLASERSCTE